MSTGNHLYTGYPIVTSDLASEPVTLAEFKSYAHVTYSDDDTVLTAILKSARIFLENYTGKSFGTKTIEVALGTSGRGINLPKGPVSAITGDIEYLEGGCCGHAAGWEVYTGQYALLGERFCAPEGDYKFSYTTAWTLPEDVKTAIKEQALYMWENRNSDKAQHIAPLAKTLVFPYVNGANLL
jgi:uncharacterized phiE125 gp8 family phage protein